MRGPWTLHDEYKVFTGMNKQFVKVYKPKTVLNYITELVVFMCTLFVTLLRMHQKPEMILLRKRKFVALKV